MGGDAAPGMMECDVSVLEVRRRDRLDKDCLAAANGRMHAVAFRAETRPAPPAHKLRGQIEKQLGSEASHLAFSRTNSMTRSSGTKRSSAQGTALATCCKSSRL